MSLQAKQEQFREQYIPRTSTHNKILPMSLQANQELFREQYIP